jgi:hypothetical protein
VARRARGALREAAEAVHLGSGKKLFRDGAKAAALRLTNATTTGAGVIIATYEPAGPARHGSYALDES